MLVSLDHNVLQFYYDSDLPVLNLWTSVAHLNLIGYPCEQNRSHG